MQENQTTDIGTIIEPEPIGFSFDAPGWAILAGILLIILLVVAIKRYINYRNNLYRREAESSLNQLAAENLPKVQLIYKINELLKRVAIISYGRESVASLYGEPWLNFLEEKVSQKPVFPNEVRRIFSSELYRGSRAKVDENELEEMKNSSINWIKKHHV